MLFSQKHATKVLKHSRLASWPSRILQEWGWNVVVIPTDQYICRLTKGGVVVMSSGLVHETMRHSCQPAAAILFNIAHEMGHHVARHLVSQP